MKIPLGKLINYYIVLYCIVFLFLLYLAIFLWCCFQVVIKTFGHQKRLSSIIASHLSQLSQKLKISDLVNYMKGKKKICSLEKSPFIELSDSLIQVQ